MQNPALYDQQPTLHLQTTLSKEEQSRIHKTTLYAFAIQSLNVSSSYVILETRKVVFAYERMHFLCVLKDVLTQ